jgi:hypothetical protein
MKLLFVHGWSVTSTKTYGDLPKVLQNTAPKELNLQIENVYLSEYISFDDDVSLEDIAHAFEYARKEKFHDEEFACITHSTGGPVIRLWIDLYYKNSLNNIPLSHLIMLAPANHGSSLAILGKSRVNRIKSWFKGIEVGEKVLDWLQLGSLEQWRLNNSFLDYEYKKDTFFPFVLSGEKIDEHFYDFINHYLVEKGSDGVIRLCAANMNYSTLTLEQKCNEEPLNTHINAHKIYTYPLQIKGDIQSTSKSAFEVIQNVSHSGDKYGIMESIKNYRTVKPVVYSIINSLQVKNKNDYTNLIEDMEQKTLVAQKEKQKHIMIVFNIQDNYGNQIDDYDMILLAGKNYEPNELPKGFFIDRQKNKNSKHLTYYLNYSKLRMIKDKKIGIRIIARPDVGFTRYSPAEFRSEDIKLEEIIKPNQTLMVNIILKRQISKNTFELNKINQKEQEFTQKIATEEFIE